MPKVVPIGPTTSKQWGEGMMVVPAPLAGRCDHEVGPLGQTDHDSRDPGDRGRAYTWGDDWPCPLTVGIFAWIAAHAAEDDFKAERDDATPYWRTLKTGGYLNEKYPGGIPAHKEKLEAEGHDIVQRGQKLRRRGLRAISGGFR